MNNRVESVEEALAKLTDGLRAHGIVMVPGTVQQEEDANLCRIEGPDPVAIVQTFVAAAAACKVPFLVVEVMHLTEEAADLINHPRFSDLLEPEELDKLRRSMRNLMISDRPVRWVHSVLKSPLAPAGLELFLCTDWSDELSGPEEVLEGDGEEEESGIDDARLTELAGHLASDARFNRAKNITERKAVARRLLEKLEDLGESELDLVISEARDIASQQRKPPR